MLYDDVSTHTRKSQLSFIFPFEIKQLSFAIFIPLQHLYNKCDPLFLEQLRAATRSEKRATLARFFFALLPEPVPLV